MERTALQARQELARIKLAVAIQLDLLEQEIRKVQELVKQRSENWQVATTEADWEALGLHLSEIYKERNLVVANLNTDLHKVLFVDRGASVEVNYHNLSALGVGKLAIVREAVNWFQKMVGTGTVDNKPVSVHFVAGNRSSHTPYTADIRLTKSAGTAIVIHELGHWLEDADPEILAKTRTFYYDRTVGEPLTSLRDYTKADYDRREMTRLDRWLDPYMGKDYYSSATQRYATEILSVGLEILYTNPCSLSEGDPEMFDFLYDLLRRR